MTTGFLSFSLLALFSLISSVTELQSQDFTGMYPASPKKLIEALPAKVEGWELTLSRGKTDIGMWLESRVTREYVRKPATPTPPTEKAPRVRLSILDTGEAEGTDLDLFADFAPAVSTGGGYEYRFLSGLPSIITTLNQSEFEAQFLVDKRFILSISLKDTPSKELKTWLERIDLERLRRIPDTRKISLPESYQSIHIDELAPGKSQEMAIGTAAEATEEAEDPDADCETE
tara:strand:- start:171 stop:863 length:693 start_codon:yes stop_codon:yes gene_type:complete